MPFLAAAVGVVAAALGVTITTLIVVSLTVLSSILMVIGQVTRNEALKLAGLIVGAAAIVYQFAVIGYYVISLHGLSLMSVGRIAVYGTRAFINNLSFGLKAILGAIRFDIALKIHRIAFILSERYRKLWSRINADLAEVSQNLEWGAAALTLFFRNTRNLVYDVSSLFGRGFDLAEVQWLKVLDRFLRDFRNKFKGKALTISRLTYWMDRWIERPYMDAKRDWVGSVVSSIDSVVTFSEALLDDIVRVRDDIDRLVSDLPKDIRKEIRPFIKGVLDEFDQVLDDYISPNFDTIREIIDALKDDRDRLEGNLATLAGRLAMPGSYLYEIEAFTTDRKQLQEVLVSEVALNPYGRVQDVVSEVSGEAWEEWAKITDAAREGRVPPSWKVPEREAPSRPADTPVAPRDTWFVGDY